MSRNIAIKSSEVKPLASMPNFISLFDDVIKTIYYDNIKEQLMHLAVDKAPQFMERVDVERVKQSEMHARQEALNNEADFLDKLSAKLKVWGKKQFRKIFANSIAFGPVANLAASFIDEAGLCSCKHLTGAISCTQKHRRPDDFECIR